MKANVMQYVERYRSWLFEETLSRQELEQRVGMTVFSVLLLILAVSVLLAVAPNIVLNFFVLGLLVWGLGSAWMALAHEMDKHDEARALLNDNVVKLGEARAKLSMLETRVNRGAGLIVVQPAADDLVLRSLVARQTKAISRMPPIFYANLTSLDPTRYVLERDNIVIDRTTIYPEPGDEVRLTVEGEKIVVTVSKLRGVDEEPDI